MTDPTRVTADQPGHSGSAGATQKPGWLFREVPAPVTVGLGLLLWIALGALVGARPAPNIDVQWQSEAFIGDLISWAITGAIFGLALSISSAARGGPRNPLIVVPACVIGVPVGMVLLRLLMRGCVWAFGSWTGNFWSGVVGGGMGLGIGVIALLLHRMFRGRYHR
jgi:hypothetical protein